MIVFETTIETISALLEQVQVLPMRSLKIETQRKSESLGLDNLGANCVIFRCAAEQK